MSRPSIAGRYAAGRRRSDLSSQLDGPPGVIQQRVPGLAEVFLVGRAGDTLSLAVGASIYGEATVLVDPLPT